MFKAKQIYFLYLASHVVGQKEKETWQPAWTWQWRQSNEMDNMCKQKK